MMWYDYILVALATVLSVGAFFFVPIALVVVTDKIIERVRRKKHPEYFKLYDAAIKESFEIGQEFNRQYDHIKFQFKMWTDGLKEGECTEEDFSKKMQQLTEQYQELCCWYTTASKYIQDLWKQVDLKAKEEDFKWGIIYDGKSS